MCGMPWPISRLPVPIRMHFTVNCVFVHVRVCVVYIYIVSAGAHGSQKRLESRSSKPPVAGPGH